MSKYTRSISEGNFLNRASIDPMKFIKQPPPNLIVLPKDMYKLFNQFQLTQSRFSSIKQYHHLVDQIKNFNKQLKIWKQSNEFQIRNFRMTYYLYQNLHSRIKFVNQLCSDNQHAKNSLIQIIHWFNQEKPKVRGAPPKKPQPLLKTFQIDTNEALELDDMTEFNTRKRQMKPYEKMARTAHTNFFPPKSRLMDYHKKEFIMDHKLTIDSNEARQMRLARTSSMKRANTNDTNNGKLRSTLNTFQNTKTSFMQTSVTGFNSSNNMSARNSTKDIIKQVKQPQNKQLDINFQIKEFSLGDPNIDPQLKMLNAEENDENVRKQQLLNQMIDQPKYQEDDKDEIDEQQFEEQPQKTKYKKTFQYDHNRQITAGQIVTAQEIVKDHQQSTLRRLLRNKQLEIQHKMQDLNIKQKMNNWGKTATFINQQMNRKSQSYRFANQFHRTQFAKKGFFQKRKQIPEFDMKTDRAKTAENLDFRNVQQSYEKRKIDNVLKSFGKYIGSHVQIANSSNSPRDNQQIQLMRATSLTAFNKKPKKKCFGDILAANDVDSYNQQAQINAMNLKQKLGKKLLSVNKKKIYSALTAVKTQRLDDVNAFPKVLNLLSNPFFPKHLYQKKKKK